MAIELTREPTSASTGDALYFIATGSSEEQLAIVVTADGDEMQRSPTFGIEDAPEGTGSDRFTLSIMGGTSGTFTLEVYEYGDPVYDSTDPIYYASDPSYTYPTTDYVEEAIEALLDGIEVTATK